MRRPVVINEVEKLFTGTVVVTYKAVDESDEIWAQVEQYLIEHMQLRQVRDGVFVGTVVDDKFFHAAIKELSTMVELENAGEVFIWYYDERRDFYRLDLS